MKARLAAGAGAVLLLAACSSPGDSDSSNPSTAAPTSSTSTATSAAPTTQQSTTPASSSTPLSVYAAKFQKIESAGLKLQVKFNQLPSDTSISDAQPLATQIVTAYRNGNAQLLREAWPPEIESDIRALVTADGPALGDFADLADGLDRLATDASAANAAYNIVLADLGLPPD